MRHFLFIHWTPMTDGARSVMAIFEVPADKPSYLWWRNSLRSTLSEGETLEFMRKEDMPS